MPVADTFPLPCIRCGAQPAHAFKDDEPTNQPYAATTFKSHGHYGSTVWDPLGRSRDWLELNVCDICLQELAELGHVVVGHLPYVERPKPQYRPWNADVQY